MAFDRHTIELTTLQVSHALTAIQAHMSALLKKSQEDPEGGEHEDYLIAQSIFKLLAKAEESADPQAR